MKVIVSSDWHADWNTDGYDRFTDVREAVNKMLESFKSPFIFLFLGDLTDPYSRTVHRAASFGVEIAATLAKNPKIYQHWLTGNHDAQEDNIGSHTLMGIAHAQLPNCRVHDIPRAVALDDRIFRVDAGVYLISLPYTSIQNSYDPAGFVEEAAGYIPKKADVIIAGHLMIDGIVAGSETTDMARGRDVQFPIEACKEFFPNAILLNGHYHKAQTFRGIHIPGSLVRLTHAEEDNTPGYIELNFGTS